MKHVRKNKNLRFLAIMFVCVITLAFGIQTAYGVPTLTLDATSTMGVDHTLTDLDGEVFFAGNVGNFQVVVTQGFTKPFQGTATDPQLDLFSVQITSLGSSLGDTLNIGFSEIDFGPFAGTFEMAVGGTTDGTVNFDAYADANNALFGTTTSLGSFSFDSSITGNLMSGSNNTPFSDSEFSLSAFATVTHAASISPLQTNFDLLIYSVPELDTGLLLGICLFGLVGIQCRRKKA